MKVLPKNPKLIIGLSVSMVLCLILLFSCKKQFASNNYLPEPVDEAKKWFETNVVDKERKRMTQSAAVVPRDASIPVFARMERLSLSVNWNGAKQYNDRGVDYIVVPVAKVTKPLGNENLEVLRGIIFYKDKSGMQMTIMEAVGKKGTSLENSLQQIASAAFINSHFHESKPVPTLYTDFVFYDESYKHKASFQTASGIWSKGTFKLLNQRGASTQKRIVSTISQTSSCANCTTWYTIGYWYDINTGEIVDSEIIDQYEECTNTEPEGPEWGESPDAPLDEECDETGTSSLDHLVNTSTVSNEMQSVTTLLNLPETRTKKYEWIILKNLTWHLFSWENGTHVKNPSIIQFTPAHRWIWRSLVHGGVAMVGVVLGGSIDYSVTSATSTIGLFHAIMDLDFKVKYSVVCKGSPISVELVYNSQKAFNVSD